MKKHLCKNIGLAVVLTLSFTLPALAILGIGDIVYDPTNYAQALQRFAQMEQQYTQIVRTYEMIRSQYQQMLFMGQQVPVAMATRYRSVVTPWLTSSAANTYGNTGAWITGIDTGLGAAWGYSAATQPLATYGPALGNIAGDQLPRVRSNYATVELTDGANVSAMQTLGQMRANAPATEATIQNLENDSLSSEPNMNTEIAVLNKINAAHLITVRNTQDANKLLVALTEQQIIEAKRTRDAEAQAINNDIQFRTAGQAAMAAQAAGASDAMLAWRMP
jgi:type IV secretion system protein TrbJ